MKHTRNAILSLVLLFVFIGTFPSSLIGQGNNRNHSTGDDNPSSFWRIKEGKTYRYRVTINNRKFKYEIESNVDDYIYNLSFDIQFNGKKGNRIEGSLENVKVNGKRNGERFSFPENSDRLQDNVKKTLQWFEGATFAFDVVTLQNFGPGKNIQPKKRGFHPILFGLLNEDVRYVLWNMFELARRGKKQDNLPSHVDRRKEFQFRNFRINTALRPLSVRNDVKFSKTVTSSGRTDVRVNIANGRVLAVPLGSMQKAKAASPADSGSMKSKASGSSSQEATRSKTEKKNIGSARGTLSISGDKGVLTRLRIVTSYVFDSEQLNEEESDGNSGGGKAAQRPGPMKKSTVTSNITIDVTQK